MNNFIQAGETMRWTNSTGSDVVSGEPVPVAGRIYIAQDDIANGAAGVLAVAGVYRCAKEAPLVIAIGSALYWDAGNAQMTTTVGANTYAGIAHQAGASADTTIDVRLQPSPVACCLDGYLPIPLGAITREDGTGMTKFADGATSTPGWSQESDKELVIRWNNHATPAHIAFSIALPGDLDSSADVEVHVLANVTGATDTPELTTEAYFGTGDTDCAGTDDEIDGADTVTEYTNVIDAADVPDPPDTLTVLMKPAAGELGTDDCRIYAIWLEYTKTG